MEKSVYSLVLMDDVVAAVDRLAYSEGASRSAMAVSYTHLDVYKRQPV